MITPPLSLSRRWPQNLPDVVLLWQHRKVAILFIPLVIALMLLLQFFTHQKQSPTAIFTQDKCFYGAGALRAEILRNKKLFPSGLDCSTPTKFIFSTDN
jgi:hypothetical protein